VRVWLREIRARLRAPFTAAHGTVSERPLLLLALSDPVSGLRGHGEAAPLVGYDGVSIGEVAAAIDACHELLADTDLATATHPVARASLIGECARRAALPQALAAIDLALHDFAGKAAGVGLVQLLGARAGQREAYGAHTGHAEADGAHAHPPAIAVNHTIAALDPEAAGEEASLAVAAGFSTVKVKVGVDIAQDAQRVAAVRAAGGDRLAIRLDANGSWGDEQTARQALAALAPYGIELCEEPIHGAARIERLAARTPVALALDESAAQPLALRRRCAQAICLKVARCGGIAGVLHDAQRAHTLGYEIYLASTLDGPLGIAAALHAATLISVKRACGLATLAMFADRPDPLPAAGGQINLPYGAGLGAGLLDFYGQA
jgi:L-alanine-DL-glutamate epimerase-like enolase superfamily enzyme